MHIQYTLFRYSVLRHSGSQVKDSIREIVHPNTFGADRSPDIDRLKVHGDCHSHQRRTTVLSPAETYSGNVQLAMLLSIALSFSHSSAERKGMMTWPDSPFFNFT